MFFLKSRAVSKVFDIFLTVLIITLVLIALVWFIHTFDIFSLPDKIENFFWPQHECDANDEIESKVVELISKSALEDDKFDFLVLTPSKATDLLKKIEIPEKFYWEVETTSQTGDDKRIQFHRIYKSGNKIRIDTTDDFIDTTTVFFDGFTYLKNNKNGETREISGDTDFAFDSIVNIAAVQYLLSEEDASVEYVSVSTAKGETFLYVDIPKTLVSGSDKYFVSLKSGLVFTATSQIGDDVVFSQETLNFDTTSLISDETFDVLT